MYAEDFTASICIPSLSAMIIPTSFFLFCCICTCINDILFKVRLLHNDIHNKTLICTHEYSRACDSASHFFIGA